jgi:hypothetical protein
VKNERLWIPPARSMTPNDGRATAIAAIGQVTSTAPVAAVAPATAVTPGLRLANLSMISFIFTIMVPLYIWPRVAKRRRKCDV